MSTDWNFAYLLPHAGSFKQGNLFCDDCNPCLVRHSSGAVKPLLLMLSKARTWLLWPSKGLPVYNRLLRH
jgi:hypothetical protein